MKFYVIERANGEFRHGYFSDYNEAVSYANSVLGWVYFTVSEYDSEEDYFNSL